MTERKRAQIFIENVKWNWAKTYAKKAPHWYCLRKECPTGRIEDFEWFIEYIREHGVQEKFWGRYYTYLYLGDYKYWTMGAPVHETEVINRAKV